MLYYFLFVKVKCKVIVEYVYFNYYLVICQVSKGDNYLV